MCKNQNQIQKIHSINPECKHFQSTLECQSQLRSVQSEYQALFEYYKDIQASSLRTYITAQLSYMMLFLHESGEYRNLSIAYQERFRRIYVDVQSKFKSKLEMATREIWSCDPLDYNGALHLLFHFVWIAT